MSTNLKNQSQNNDENNNGENNSNNANLAQTLIFQVDTDKNVVTLENRLQGKHFLRVYFIAICLIVLLFVCSFVFAIF